MHDYADEQALAILERVRCALPAGGVLLLAEPMAETAHTDPVSDAYLGLYLLAMGPGRPRTPDALSRLLRAAGFDEIRQRRTRMPMLLKVLEARASPQL